MLQLPDFLLFLLKKPYFHLTNELCPPTMVSVNRFSIWKKTDSDKSNGALIVVSHNGGRDVFLFIYCSICNKWRMPTEGGHTGSHHQHFLNGQVCLPVGHTAWSVYFNIITAYGLPFPIPQIVWNPAHQANALEQADAQLPWMMDIPQAVYGLNNADQGLALAPAPPARERAMNHGRANNAPLQQEEDDDDVEDEGPPPPVAPANNAPLQQEEDDDDVEDEGPPPPVAPAVAHANENNVNRREIRFPRRPNAGQIDRFIPENSRKRRRNQPLLENDRNRDQPSNVDESDSDFDDADKSDSDDTS